MTMDLLCQEMRDACWDSSESLCSSCSLFSQYSSERFSCGVSRDWVRGKANCHSKQKPLSHHGSRAVTTEERDVVRENKEEGV